MLDVGKFIKNDPILYPLGSVVTDLKINETTLISHTVAGSLDRFGNFKGTN